MICRQCGNTININDHVCGVCGAVIEFQTMLVDDDAQSEQNPYSEEQPEPQFAQPVQPEPQFAQPVQPEPQFAQPVQPEPQFAQPIQPAPMRPQYENSQPVQPQSVPQSQPIQPQYVHPQPVQPQYAQPQYAQPQPIQAPVTPESQALSKSILGFGIAAIICAWFPIGSILGIIFGAIAKGRAKTFDMNGFPTNGRRVAGKVLGIIGFITGIILTVYYTLFLFASL